MSDITPKRTAGDAGAGICPRRVKVHTERRGASRVDEIRLRPGVHATGDYALWLEGEKTLVIADLHLGYEGAAQERGVALPRFQKRVMLGRLGRLLARYSPETVVVAGDFKHEFSRNLEDEWRDVREVLTALTAKTKVVLVRGNHDNFLATISAKFGLDLPMRHQVGGFTIAHGHEAVAVDGTLVMGHEHPAVKLRDFGAIVSAPAFVVLPDRILLPAFSPLALGVDVNEYPKLSPMLQDRSLDGGIVIALDEKEGLLDFGPAKGLTERKD